VIAQAYSGVPWYGVVLTYGIVMAGPALLVRRVMRRPYRSKGGVK